MQDDEARQLVGKWWDMWRHGNLDVVGELCQEPYIRHTAAGSETLTLAQYKERVSQARRVLHGAVTTIDDEVVAGDKVWARATSRGVSLETSESNVITWFVVHRIENGKLAEIWAATLAGVEWER